MKEVNCNIIRDILPLYVDEVVSDDTKELVEEHLEGCEECSWENEVLKMNIMFTEAPRARIEDGKPLKKIKNRYRLKKWLTALIAVVITVAFIFGGYCYANVHFKLIPYDSGRIVLEEKNGVLSANCPDGKYAKVSVVSPMEIIVNGERKTILIFAYAETPWIKYIASIWNKEIINENTNSGFELGLTDTVDAVYYGKVKLDHIHEQLPDVLDELELVWEK